MCTRYGLPGGSRGRMVIRMNDVPRASDERHDRAAYVSQQVADRVAAEILRRGLYKTDVAKAAQIAQSTFSQKVNGHTEFTIAELVRVAAALGIEHWWELLPAPAALTARVA